MSASAQPRLTPEQYLAIERAAEFRSEYYDGVMYAMSGGSSYHSHITGNLAGEFRDALKKRPCLVMPNDMRVRVGQGRLYCYPDLVIACEPRKFADDQKDTLLNPTVIVEVLSPSTESYDRGAKAAQYRTIPSLQAYALVSQDQAHVEIYHRHSTGEWLLTDVDGLDGICHFPELAGARVSIPMAEIYDKVEF
ncbi:MAG: Uma2 family endonuclease [Bryobacteraceae bacterium]